MAFDLSHIRFRGGHMKNRNVQALTLRAECSTGGLYKNPTVGQSIDALQPLDIQWDPSCVSGTDKIDIYVKAPSATVPVLHRYYGVGLASGSYTANLEPKWWNATSSVQLQLAIYKHGEMAAMNDLAAGPVFTATYTAPSDGSVPASADTSSQDSSTITDVSGAAAAAESSHKGRTAAAVLVPLIFLICLGVLGYIKWKRVKQNQKSQEFSEKVDRRMSTISGDWRSMTAGGAKEAVRASMYQQDSSARFSTFSYSNSNGTRSSTYAVEGGAAGIGARGLYHQDNSSLGDFDYVNGYSPSKTHTPRQRSHSNNVMRPSFTQSRVSFAESVNTPPSHLRNPRGSIAEGSRQSRVSFADGTRPSVDSRYSRSIGQGERGSRAFHSAFTVGQDEDVPPVPTRRISTESTGDVADVLSPKQRAGALTLSNDDITKMTRDDEEIGAAISYIQGPVSAGAQDVLFAVPPTPGPATASSTIPIAPSPTYSPTTPSGVFAQQQTASTKVAVSPLGPMPMGAGAAGVQAADKYMSPDEMLRAYAMRQQMSGTMTPTTAGTPGSAQPMMRGPGVQQMQHTRKQSLWDEQDAYGGM